MLSAVSIVFTIICQIPLFYYINDIARLFTKDPEIEDLLVEVLPIVFICFFFDVVQA